MICVFQFGAVQRDAAGLPDGNALPRQLERQFGYEVSHPYEANVLEQRFGWGSRAQHQGVRATTGEAGFSGFKGKGKSVKVVSLASGQEAASPRLLP